MMQNEFTPTPKDIGRSESMAPGMPKPGSQVSPYGDGLAIKKAGTTVSPSGQNEMGYGRANTNLKRSGHYGD